mmetsp:Transcript_11226/g.24275  ORF Transcript_11226/g.24275 Transcript_11226/m.24275 type:complete len:303 (-) Transcript_11226:334-1242(-)
MFGTSSASLTDGSIPQSVPLCIVLSAIGGILEVFATALLAYVDVKQRSGRTFPTSLTRGALAANVALQILASVVGNLFAPWFGPISLVGPFFLSAQLVANMFIFGVFLGIESFPKDMKVGTYIIVVSAAILTAVGPTAQIDQNVMELLSNWYSIAWSGLILAGMFVACAFLPLVAGVQCCTCTRRWCCQFEGREPAKFAVLLMARSTAFTVNLSVSKMMVGSPNRMALIVAIILKILSGAVMTYNVCHSRPIHRRRSGQIRPPQCLVHHIRECHNGHNHLGRLACSSVLVGIFGYFRLDGIG